jgi:hypothetical protein
MVATFSGIPIADFYLELLSRGFAELLSQIQIFGLIASVPGASSTVE